MKKRRQHPKAHAQAWTAVYRWWSDQLGTRDIEQLSRYKDAYLGMLDDYIEADPHYLANRMSGPRCPVCKLPYPNTPAEWYPCASLVGVKRVWLHLQETVARIEDREDLIAYQGRQAQHRAWERGENVPEPSPVGGTIPMAFAGGEDE